MRTEPAQAPVVPPRRGTLGEVALLFLKLGTIAFGGPAAHIALMEDEVVRQRGWLTREAFLDLLGAASLIPGPSSTELAIYIGHDQAGWPGLIAGGVCFILPAALIVVSLAWAYVRFGALPAVVGVLYGIKPVVIAVVAQALWGMARTAVKTRALALLGAAAVAATLLGADQLAVLVGAGVLSALACGARRARRSADHRHRRRQRHRPAAFPRQRVLAGRRGGAARLAGAILLKTDRVGRCVNLSRRAGGSSPLGGGELEQGGG